MPDHKPPPPATLPAIVEKIREQQPGVVPAWLDVADTFPTTFREVIDDENTRRISERVAIAVLEAALWRAFYEHKPPESNLFFWDKEPRGWCVYGMRYGNDELALIRALCQVVGVRLEDK